jgi:hypothetical protein
MMFERYPALSQDPINLMHPTYSLDAIREEEVKNIGERISDAKEINDLRAKRLNQTRIAAALSPLVFVATAMMAPPMAPKKVDNAKVTCTADPVASTPRSFSLKCDLIH